ncbi:hypothetical protein Bca4012_079499 [Brassica carinata]|uniref:Uncharacterized protein n=2 Tax=Brassica TaxID=3705 RepID=A0ABQ7YQJ6_BRANA|nr:hypothetical protein HID58_077505 [Brassica napus]VDD39469.1 unnamed protein product [Brassica oleracea]
MLTWMKTAISFSTRFFSGENEQQEEQLDFNAGIILSIASLSGSDRVGNDRHVEEEPQSIQNSLRMVSCKVMLPLFWSSLMVA